MLKAKSEYYIFLMILYLFVFEFALMDIIPVFKYWDELYAMFSIFLYLSKFKGKIFIGNIRSKLVVSLSLFLLVGILGNIIYKYQEPIAVFQDVFLNCKFILGMLTTYYLFCDTQLFKYKKLISFHIHLLISVLFILLVFDMIFEVFPSPEVRFGLRAEQLIYTHPTQLASVSFFLLLLNITFAEENRGEKKYIVLSTLLIIMTLRMKAIAIVTIFLISWFLVVILKKKIKLKHIIVFIPIAIYIAWDQIYVYFFSDLSEDTVRGALTFTSFKILKEYFPIGTGFGTFASAPSGEYYSPIYYKYNLSNLWGLTPDAPDFVADAFWPMLIGQIGLLGVVVFAYIIFALFREIRKSYDIDKKVYVSGVGVLLYLLISSLAESSFVNPLSVSFSVIIGFCFMLNERKPKNIIEK